MIRSLRCSKESAAGQTISSVLALIRQQYLTPRTTSQSCHARVADYLRQTGVDDKRVVLLGWRDTKTILHSMVTDLQGRPLFDSMRGILRSDTYAFGADALDVVATLLATEFLQ